MQTLRSHVEGNWHEATTRHVPLANPCTEEIIAQASSEGIDFQRALDFTRRRGGAALRELTVGQRAELLAEAAKVLHDGREELIALSLTNTGTTRKDAKFDIDGATFTLSHYAGLGKTIGQRHFFEDGDGIQLGRTARFWGQHLLVPRVGAAVLVNAFNFPVWGFAEKAACALLAGVPVITKPATSSALVTERSVAMLVEAGVFPEGALSLICGSTGNLLDLLGEQDVLAFTGSAATAEALRSKANLLRASTRVNIEADSLNAAVLGPDVEPGGETWAAFTRDVAREMTQKTGQKCTAVRRILVPAERRQAATEALVDLLEQTVTGNPLDASVTMGPLATAQQLRDAESGVQKLGREAELVLGSGVRIDGVGNPAGKGFFFAPTLLGLDDPERASVVHSLEVFGPVSTVIPYDATADRAAEYVSRGGGSLVTSIYSDDQSFLRRFLSRAGATCGRLYIGSEKAAPQLPGSGVAMPQVLHGGPGRAGGGAELGGARGLELYLQRVAVTGDRSIIERIDAEPAR